MTPSRLRTAVLLTSAGFLAACGPTNSTLRKYVETSPRRAVALLPLTVAPGQRNLANLCESRLIAGLDDRGFAVGRKKFKGADAPVFGPDETVPRVSDVQAYGRRMRAPVVLVGRLTRAVERLRERDAVVRDRVRYASDAWGRRTRVAERVTVRPAVVRVAAGFRLNLRLLDTETGDVLWSQDFPSEVPEWTLRDQALHACDSAADQLAEAYFKNRL